MAPDDSVNLTSDQLGKLAKLAYLKEVEVIQNINFTSEHEQVHHLRECKMGYKHTLEILDAGNAALITCQGDTTKEPIAHDIVSYSMKACNLAWMSIRNYHLRLAYLKKIIEHSEQIFLDLEKLDATNVTNVARLAKEASEYNKAILMYNKRYQSLPSTLFADWIKESGMTFEEIVRKYQGVLGLPGAFKDLEMADKLKVYNKIIDGSGLGNGKMTKFEAASGAAGMGVLGMTAGLMVWDISTSHHKIHRATTDGWMVVSSVAGNAIGNAVKTALTIELIGLVEVSTFTMPVVGFVVSVVAGLIISAIGNYIIDLIFTGEEASVNLPLATDGHRYYAAEMPDGKALAHQIVYYSR